MWLLDEELEAEGKAAKAVGVPMSVITSFAVAMLVYCRVVKRSLFELLVDRSPFNRSQATGRPLDDLKLDQNHNPPAQREPKVEKGHVTYHSRDVFHSHRVRRRERIR
jgi:hypothetical protein